MTSPLLSLEPNLLWSHFDGIRKIPRPSKHEERIAKHVEEWAVGRGFSVVRDSVGSMTVTVPATPGHEDAPTVVLQGHLDMVCEKNSDVELDFMNDPIEVTVDGDWVKAVGTTLGADNGIGVAAAMAIADDPEAVHGPLELLCTVDEETGLTGAKELEPSLIKGRLLVNLDTEEDGAIYIGCAGGADVHTELPLTRRRGLLGSTPVQLVVRGLRGGHSGLHIIENRANAIKLTTRVLIAAIDAGVEIDLVSLDGGSKHNAIPRETAAVMRIPDHALPDLQEVVDGCVAEFRDEFGSVEPDMEVTVEAVDDTADLVDVINVHGRDRLLRLLNALPHGVLAMSREVPGLVETSNNLAVVQTSGPGALVITSHRSSIMPALYAVGGQIRSMALQAGATVTIRDAYPGWKPNPSSALVQKTVEVFEKVFNKSPDIKAIHAGLECGLILEKVPGMDAVSIGPEIVNAHSPDEAVQISTVGRFYQHLKALLADLAG